MGRICYEGKSMIQLHAFAKELIERRVPFEVEFSDECDKWYLTGTSATSCGGTDAEIIKEIRQKTKQLEG